jgi:hypothetical protein
MVSILKPGKDPTLPSSYRPTSLLDTVGKLFEKILLARLLREINDHFGFRPRHSTTLQLARPVKKSQQKLRREAANRRGFPGCGLSLRHRMGQRPPVQANRPKLPILPGENHILTPWLPDVPNVVPVSHIHMSWHAGWYGAGWNRLSGAVQPVCERHPPATLSQRNMQMTRLL